MQLKALLPLFSASLGTDTEQTDPCDYILRESVRVCMCGCTVCMREPVFWLYTSNFFHVRCGKIVGDFVFVCDSAQLWEAATPGGSD